MDNLNILIVEDESLVAMSLSSSIGALGYNVVEYATNSHMAKKFLEAYDVNLILMDINLNESINGIELYESLHSDIALIYLTAYKDEDTMSKAIKTNPIGYLIKPHKDDELRAMLKLALYKIQNKEEAQVESRKYIDIGKGYLFDIEENKLLYKNKPIKLTIKETNLLKLLIDAKGRTVKFTTIEEKIWEGENVNNTSLRTLLYRLRSKLKHKLIESEFNIGLKLDIIS
ncbi:MAG: DNA-binding response regulator [Sulfurimonas sp.]